ncbi:MAG: hypothetical protein IJT04_04165 [Bacteroidales bacterium]|nr:hypothetical protein [Bacteroidales bacterium]
MRKVIFTTLMCSIIGFSNLFAQRVTQATIIFWDSSQPQQIFDDVMNFKFNDNQLLVESSNQSVTAIDITDIRKITLASTNSI